jgi:hemoglobin-like flavoprotein
VGAVATATAVVTFHSSLERAAAHARFADVFYARFMASSAAVAAIFAGVDVGKLKRKLRASLHVMTLAADDAPGTDLYLDYLGAVHTQLDIRPEMYDAWLDALVGTVAECDPEFCGAIERAWRSVIGAGVARIKRAGTEARSTAAAAATAAD